MAGGRAGHLALIVLPLLWGRAIAQELQVQEIEGIIVLKEPVNLQRIQDHLHLWISELGASNEKLDKLQAVSMMRDSALLVDTILQLTSHPGLVPLEAPRRDKEERQNTYDRYKRNILGDFLSAVTGVATEEELQQQLKIDNDIRDKVVTTLARQVTFEKSIAAYYTNLTREEEQMHKRIDTIATQRIKDKHQISRLMILSAVAMDDIKDMEDTLHILWTGDVPARHAVKLARYANLPKVALFTYVGVQPGVEGPVLEYTARTYQTTPATATPTDSHINLKTSHSMYLLHMGYSLHLPITELEVMATGQDCVTCAHLVHLVKTTYKVTHSGELSCTDRPTGNLTVGHHLQIGQNTTCWNRAIKVDAQRIRHKEYVLDPAADKKLDSALLQRNIDRDKLSLMTPTQDKEMHQMVNFKLQHEILQAQQDLDTFIVDTKTDMTVQFSHSTATWGILGGVGAAVLVIIVCIFVRYKQNGRATNTVIVANPMATSPV
jgi:hypothetical protein